jgi:hypothetical protein
MIKRATVEIELDHPDMREIKAVSSRIEAATERKPEVLLYGEFEADGDLVFSSPLKVLGYLRKGKIKAKVDGEVLNVTVTLIERAYVLV